MLIKKKNTALKRNLILIALIVILIGIFSSQLLAQAQSMKEYIYVDGKLIAVEQQSTNPSDTEPPTITITSPTSGSTYSTTSTPITLGGTASDNVGVTQVTWANNRGGSGSCSGTNSWTCSSIVLQSGQNVLTVTATDAASNSGTDVLTVTFTPPDTQAPTITITSPTSGSTYSTTSTPITLGGTASDNVGVTQVTWANNRGGSGSCSGTNSWTCSGIALQSGQNVLTVTATDAASNSGTDVLTVTYTIECTYSINPTSRSIGSGGGTGSVTVTASNGSCGWTASSNNSWITVTGGSSGTGNGTVSYSISSNSGPARNGTVTIAGHTFSVSQSNGCSYSINPTSRSIGSGGGTGTVSVTSSNGSCGWTASSNNSWITVTGGSSGTGNGTVSYSISSNSGPARNGTVTIAGHTFTVSQSNGCSYSINPTSRSIGAGGGTGSVSVTASNGSCGWTATSNDSWITITSGSSGSGNGTVNYSVDSNSGSGRSGTATIAGHTFTINQEDGGCYSYCQTQYVDDCVGGFYAQCYASCGGNPGCIISCMMYMEPQINAVCNPDYCEENICQ